MLSVKFHVHARLPALMPTWLGFLCGSPSLVIDDKHDLPVRWNKCSVVGFELPSEVETIHLSLAYDDPHFFARFPSAIIWPSESDCFLVEMKAQ